MSSDKATAPTLAQEGLDLQPHAFHLQLPPHHRTASGVPYITIHAQRKARAIWKLVHSIELTDALFLDSAADNNGDGLNGVNGNNGGEGGNNGVGKVVNKATTEEDDIDSDDEVDDEGEELLIEGGAVSVSLICGGSVVIVTTHFTNQLRDNHCFA
eukprot:scaffold1020_cov106-Skeletonema_dohrnii-CCMP3373.AAC.2